LLTDAPAAFVPANFGGNVSGRGVEPPRDHLMASQLRRFPSQQNEDALRDIGGRVTIAVSLPKRRMVNQPDVPPDKFRKCILGTIPNIAGKQVGIIEDIEHDHTLMAATGKIAPGKCDPFRPLNLSDRLRLMRPTRRREAETCNNGVMQSASWIHFPAAGGPPRIVSDPV
jgi:hypothetical protein